MKHKRHNQAGATVKRDNTLPIATKTVAPASLADYLDPCGRQYAPRQHPHRLNWGERKNMDQLNIAGKKANRYPIKGDWDYVEAGQ
jgi:hypothetical protein